MLVSQVRAILVLSITGFLIALSATARAGFFYGKRQYYTLKTEHFYIHYPEGLGQVADELKTIAEEEYERLIVRLYWRPRGRIHVILSDKTDQANGLASVIPFNYILMYTAKPTADSSLDHYKEYLRLLFNHELTHIIHSDMNYRWARLGRFFLGKIVAPNGATPAWMREGMAVYEESVLAPGFGRNNSAHTEMVLRTAIYEGTFPRLDQIAGLTRQFPGGTGPYLFGGKFFEWLAETYGEKRMYKYQKLYASGLWLFSLNNKARRVYGKSFYKLWNEFKAHLTQKYEALRRDLTALGLTHFETVVKNDDSQQYYTPSPNGEGYAYYEKSFDHHAAIVIKPDARTEPIRLKRKLFGQMSFSKDGRYLAFSTLAGIEPKTSRSEVYYYDTKKKKLFRVAAEGYKKKSMHVRDPDFSPVDGGQRWLVMVRTFLNTDQLYVYDLFEKKGYVITREPKDTQFSNPRFSPDGKKIVVSRRDPKTGFRDIVIYSRLGKKLLQVTRDAQADAHPVFSPDGSRVYFDTYRTGVANIFEYDLKKKTLTQLTNVLDGVFQPMPSADGSWVFVKRARSRGDFIQKFDSRLRNRNLEKIKLVSEANPFSDTEMATRNFSLRNPCGPGKKCRPLLYEHPSDPGLYLKEMDEKTLLAGGQLAPTGTGGSTSFAYTPQASIARFSFNPDDAGRLPGILFDGQDYEDIPTEPEPPKTEEQKAKVYPSSYKDNLSGYPGELPFDRANPPGAKKYNPLPELLFPRYVMPEFLIFENAVLLGGAVGRNDPLFRHSWTAFVNYRTDAQFVGGGGTYIYSRYDPVFYVGGLRYVVDWGNVNNVRFFEERNQVYGGVSYAIKKHRFNAAYFYENRSAFTDLNVNLINMKPYAGFRFEYNHANYDKFVNSISQENGYQIRIAGEWTDVVFGSDEVNEERALRGDLRYYLEMPWADHHVLGVRAAMGWVWGDQQQFGAYRLGGPFGEGVGANYSSRLFPLRGLAGITFGGDYVFIFSAEYRLPLIINANRGIGTWPVFLDKLKLNFFVDGGDIKFRNERIKNENGELVEPALFSRMLVAVGAELGGDVVLGYGLPLQVRLGYGIILTNRDRFGSLTDAITGQSLRYGSVYFQLGTMF